MERSGSRAICGPESRAGGADSRRARRRTGARTDARLLQVPGPVSPHFAPGGDPDLHQARRTGPGSPCRRRHTLVEALPPGARASAWTSARSPNSSRGEITVYSEAELDTLERWAVRVPYGWTFTGRPSSSTDYAEPWLLQAPRSSVAVAAAKGDRAGAGERHWARHAAPGSVRPLRRAANRAMGARRHAQAHDDRRIPRHAAGHRDRDG